MQVTIDHREVLSIFGRRQFYVDCTVRFSEAERAVIRNRQLGDHHLEVNSDIPRFRSVSAYVIAHTVLTLVFWLSLVALLPVLAICAILEVNGGWWALNIMACVGSFMYRGYLDRRHKRSIEPQIVTVSQLLRQPKFTVCEPDAYFAQETEQAILGQLSDFKNRMIAVAPGLAEKQVYARE